MRAHAGSHPLQPVDSPEQRAYVFEFTWFYAQHATVPQASDIAFMQASHHVHDVDIQFSGGGVHADPHCCHPMRISGSNQ